MKINCHANGSKLSNQATKILKTLKEQNYKKRNICCKIRAMDNIKFSGVENKYCLLISGLEEASYTYCIYSTQKVYPL